MVDFIDYFIDGNLFQANHPYEPEWYFSWLQGRDFMKRRQAAKKHCRPQCHHFDSRDTLCVVGRDNAKVTFIKDALYRMTLKPCESFTFKEDGDLQDGALLVSKVIMVATFQPGRKLVDEVGDEGQLDAAYDEVCKNRGDLLVVYMNLPSILYPRFPQPRLYHPGLETLIFPQQALLKRLAKGGLLLTLCETDTSFNAFQQARLVEWINAPSKINFSKDNDKNNSVDKYLDKQYTESKCRDKKIPLVHDEYKDRSGKKGKRSKDKGLCKGGHRGKEAGQLSSELSAHTDSEEDREGCGMAQETVPLIQRRSKSNRPKYRNFLRSKSYGTNL